MRNECEQLEKSLESWKVKYNELEKDLNTLKAYCTKLEKDLADLEGWKYKCTELQLRVTQIERNMELECFRAVAKERTQWENREERLVQQLRELQLQQHYVHVGLLPETHHQYMTQNEGEAVKQPRQPDTNQKFHSGNCYYDRSSYLSQSHSQPKIYNP